ncbi:hypothetical protein LTR85_003828 [Meristemomyces frigidus]|nr:hypothetical protein LTR85_003828 [Meristemomyces frigidus]
MWLLDTTAYELKYFFSAAKAPPYAILSHTWDDGEVLFSDIQELENAKSKQGWDKIASTCRQAVTDGLEWAWIDTCCIDKSSSADLSEAINSMYSWYGNSAVCYVFLADLESDVPLRDDAEGSRAWIDEVKALRKAQVLMSLEHQHDHIPEIGRGQTSARLWDLSTRDTFLQLSVDPGLAAIGYRGDCLRDYEDRKGRSPARYAAQAAFGRKADVMGGPAADDS